MVATEAESSMEVGKETFSPLFVGAMVATEAVTWTAANVYQTFSPLFVGAMVATCAGVQVARTGQHPFSPLFVGAMVATIRHWN